MNSSELSLVGLTEQMVHALLPLKQGVARLLKGAGVHVDEHSTVLVPDESAIPLAAEQDGQGRPLDARQVPPLHTRQAAAHVELQHLVARGP